MLDFQQKRKVRSILYSRVTLVVLSIVVLFALHSTWQVYQKKRESEALKEISAHQVAELSARQDELANSISRLQTDSGKESEIRSKFSVVKGTENMVVVVDDEAQATTTSNTKGSWWQNFLGFFGVHTQ